MSELNEARIRAARPKDKPYKLRDRRGLYLLVTPTGGSLWRLRFRYAGRENMLSLGAYPDVSLKGARDRCDDYLDGLRAGANVIPLNKAS